MSDWLSSTSMVDVVLIVVALEALWLIGARKMMPVEVILCLLPGLLLLLALRASVAGSGGWWIAALLAASFPVHLADLARRRGFASPRAEPPPAG